MTHAMTLQARPFHQIASGRKTIELRLYDEKRQTIQVKDTIVFTNAATPHEQITVTVKALHRFPDFATLYRTLPLEQCGYAPEEIDTASPKDMEVYYPAEKQQQYGVLGIEIQLCPADPHF